jgi:tetratricopeptide (TPR) repeat protein
MDYNFEEDENYIRELLERFKKTNSGNGSSFFDSQELEDIIYHFFSESDFQNAKKAIDLGMKCYPLDNVFQLLMAQYLVNNEEPGKALALLTRIQPSEPNNPDIITTKASVFSVMNKHDEAIREYRKALKFINEGVDEIYTNIAFEYEALNEYGKAIGYLKKAHEIDPQNEGVLYELGYCFEIGSMPEQSITFFEEVVNRDPYLGVGWYNLGLAYKSIDLYEKAIEAFDFSIAIDPEFTPAYYIKAQTFESMELFHQAIKVYKQTFEYEKPDAMVYYYIGDCYEQLKKYETAIEYYHKSIDVEQQLSDAWMGIGICTEELGKREEALPFMQQAVKLEPQNADYWYIIADCHNGLKCTDEALEAYRKVTELDPGNPEIWLDLSDLYAKDLNDIDKAIELIDEGIAIQPSNYEFMYRRIAYLLEAGKQKEAVRELYLTLPLDYEAHRNLLSYSQKARLNPSIMDVISTYVELNGL